VDYFLNDRLTEGQSRALAAFVEGNSHCHVFQHACWVSVSGRTRRSQYVYFWGEERGEVRVSALVHRMQLPGTRWRRDNVERGPVCDDPSLLIEATAELAQRLQAAGSVSLTVNPYWAQAEARQIEAGLGALGFVPLVRRNAPHSHSLVIDLTRSETDIFGSFRESTRRAIKRAQKMGLVVAPAEAEQDMEAFHHLSIRAAAANGLQPLERGYLVRLWQQCLADQRYGLCLLARYQGQLVSAHIALKHGVRAEYVYAPSWLDCHRDLPKNHLNVWEAVQWARARGCSTYDMGGYVLNAPEGSQVAGVNQFKLGFTRTQVDLVREHRRVFRPFGHWLLTRLAMARHRVRTSLSEM
jgi:Acetyltransferase (GNAT) domain